MGSACSGPSEVCHLEGLAEQEIGPYAALQFSKRLLNSSTSVQAGSPMSGGEHLSFSSGLLANTALFQPPTMQSVVAGGSMNTTVRPTKNPLSSSATGDMPGASRAVSATAAETANACSAIPTTTPGPADGAEPLNVSTTSSRRGSTTKVTFADRAFVLYDELADSAHDDAFDQCNPALSHGSTTTMYRCRSDFKGEQNDKDFFEGSTSCTLELSTTSAKLALSVEDGPILKHAVELPNEQQKYRDQIAQRKRAVHPTTPRCHGSLRLTQPAVPARSMSSSLSSAGSLRERTAVDDDSWML